MKICKSFSAAVVAVAVCCAAGFASAASGVVREQTVAVEGLAASLASGGELSLPAFDGRIVKLALGQRTPSLAGRSTFGAVVDGSATLRATVVETATGFIARVPERAGGKMLEFRCDGPSLLVREMAVPRGKCAECSGERIRKKPNKFAKEVSKPMTGDPVVDGKAIMKGESLTNVVDVMVVFDASGAAWVRDESIFAGVENAVETFAADRIESMNNDLAASGLGDLFSFRLVGVSELESSVEDVLDEDEDVDISKIYYFLADEDVVDDNPTRALEWKAVQARRKELGADLVSVLVLGSDDGTVGIGTGVDEDLIVHKELPDYIYNVCAVNVAAYDHTMTHECAHNMGAGHAIMHNASADRSGPQLYDYSIGHYFDVTNSEGVVIEHCATIMAYNNSGRPLSLANEWLEYATSHWVTVKGELMTVRDSPYWNGNWASGFYLETGYFSSPNVCARITDVVTGEEFDTGVPTGTAEHDNARLLSLTYPLVANYFVHKNQLLLDATVGGSVSGSGAYEPGKSVAVSASPEEGCVFAGWYADESRETPADIPGFDYRAAKVTVSMPDEPLTLFAKFISAEDDAELSLDEDGATFVVSGSTNIALTVRSKSMPTVSVTGLPSGFQFDASSLTISCAPSKPETFAVKVSMTNASVAQPVVAQFTIKVPNLVDDGIPVEDAYGPFVPGASYTNTVLEAAGCTVTGLPAGFKWTDKDIVDAKTKAVVPAYSFYGAPTTPGSYTVSFTKTVDGVKHLATSTFTVLDLPALTIEVEGTGTGKVSGAGSYAANKKVALKATADKDCVFMGWYDGDECVSKLASYSLVMPETDLALVAKFTTSEEDAANIKLSVDGEELRRVEDSAPYQVTNICGVAMNWPVEADALSATTVKVAGLPSGLKFTAKDIMKKGSKTEVEIPANTIYGAPSAASKTDKNGNVTPSTVKITVTTAGKSTANYVIALVVDPLPAWAVGSFEGHVMEFGVATMSVTSAGKVSGKIACDGTNWTFKADSFAADSSCSNFSVVATATAGKESRSVLLDVYEFPTEYLPDSATAKADGMFGDDWTALCRLPWTDKNDPAPKAYISTYAGAYTCKVPYGDEEGVATFTLDEKGVAKGSIELPDGTKTRKAAFSANVLTYGGSVYVAIYSAPDAKKRYPAVFALRQLAASSGPDSDCIVYRDPGVVASTKERTKDSGASGTVTMNPKYGQVAAGKTVTLTAKAGAGSVFSYWLINGAEVSESDLKSATVKVAANGVDDVSAVAYFVTAEEDKANIGLIVGNDDIGRRSLVRDSVPGGTNYVMRGMCGVALEWEATPSCLSLATVKAANLPAGLKLVQDKATKEYSLSGVPTKAETKRVVFTVTTAGKASETFSMDLEIEPLPSWAYGTFNGWMSKDGVLGTMTLTVSSVGKVSAQCTWEDGSKTRFGYGSIVDVEDESAAVVLSESSKMENPVAVAISRNADSGCGEAEIPEQELAHRFEGGLVQTIWSEPAHKTDLAAKGLVGQFKELSDGEGLSSATLSVSATGALVLKGTHADNSGSGATKAITANGTLNADLSGYVVAADKTGAHSYVAKVVITPGEAGAAPAVVITPL